MEIYHHDEHMSPDAAAKFAIAIPDDVIDEFAIAGTPAECLAKARGIATVLITGTVANVCCESTARDASTVGYRVIMVADANAAMRDQDLNATLHTIYRTFGDVRPTAEVIELLAAVPASVSGG